MLTDKWCVITGASRGIGKETAKLFKQNNANLILISRNSEDIEIEGEKFSVDLSNYEEVKKLFKKISKITKKIDVLVNNAAIMHTSLIAMTKPEDIERVFKTNVFSNFYIASFASRFMLRSKNASIINIGSILARGALGHSVYSASKAALIGFTKSLAKELAPIRVNMISPSIVKTDMTKNLDKSIIEKTLLKRMADPIEIAKVSLFLASDMSSYITGENINVDGGLCSI